MATQSKKQESTGMYTAGMVCGIIGVVLSFIPGLSWVGLILGVLALVFGIIGLVKKAGGGKSVAATVLGAISVVVSIAAMVIIANAVNTVVNIIDDGLTDTINDIMEDYDDDVIGTKVNVTLGEYQDAQDDTWSDKALPVTITNISDETLSFSVGVEAIDGDGNRLDTDTVYASKLAPGQSYTEETFDWSSVDESILEKATFRVYRANSY